MEDSYTPPVPNLTLYVSSFGVPVCIFYNKNFIVSMAVLVSSVSFSSELLKLRRLWEPLGL